VRIRQLVACAAGLVVVVSNLGLSSPAVASGGTSISISFNAPTRVSSTGFLNYSVTTSSSGYFQAGEVCEYPGFTCTIGFQAEIAKDKSVLNVGSSTIDYPTPAATDTFAGAVDTAPVDAFRAYITGSGGLVSYSAWVAVKDPYKSPAPTVAVAMIGRSKTTGFLVYNLSASASAYFSTNGVCSYPGFTCTLGIQAKYGTASTIENVDSTVLTYPVPAVTHQFTSSTGVDSPKITSVRSYVSGVSGNGSSFIYSAWRTVNDPYQDPSASLLIKTFSLNSITGNIDVNLTASSNAYFSQNGVCRHPGFDCTIGINAKYGSTGAVTSIESATIPYPAASITQTFVSSTSLTNATALQAYVTGGDGTVAGKWIPVSNFTQNGMDTAAALALLVAGVGSSAVPCYTLFPVGTHLQRSSLSDQQIACEAALVSGQSLRDFLASLVVSSGPAILTPLLLLAGVQSNTYNEGVTGISVGPSGTVLPNNCTYTALFTITCVSGSTSTTIRDPGAPIQQDPVTENNQLQQLLQNTPEGSLPPAPQQGPIPGPLVGATPDDIANANIDTCKQWVDKVTTDAAGNGTTFGAIAGVIDEQCSTSPIYFAGTDTAAATDHDAAAIQGYPAWLKLTYVSNAEKSAAGITRRIWKGYGNCQFQTSDQQCDEYPYFSTAQGYPTTTPTALIGPLSLAAIASADNQKQGTNLKNFYNNFCPQIAASTNGSSGRNFLVIPLPRPLPSAYYCGITSP
jgi:hypothetical protein